MKDRILEWLFPKWLAFGQRHYFPSVLVYCPPVSNIANEKIKAVHLAVNPYHLIQSINKYANESNLETASH